jgi:L-threonylcarbamoyladenylate synthase
LNQKEVLKQLRAGGLLLVRDRKAAWLCGSTRSAPAWQAADSLSDKLIGGLVLIGESSQLREYVQRVPDMAWDLLDFAEKPLHLQLAYPHELLPAYLLEAEGLINVMLVNFEPLKSLLQSLGHGMFALQLTEELAREASKFENLSTFSLPDAPNVSISPERRMQLSMNGEVRFRS